MKAIKILHAHNFGHKNIGDDAMADNIYNKLSKLTNDLWTISTYSPPTNSPSAKDIKSISKIINNYDNIFIKLFLVTVNKLKLKTIYSIYSFCICEYLYLLSIIKIKFGYTLSLNKRVRQLIWGLSETETYIRSGSGSLNDIWFWSSMYPQYTEARIAKLFGAKVIFVGQGIGPITTNYRLNILRDFIETCDEITLRDPNNSSKLISSVNPKVNNWSVVGDDAFDYPKETLPESIQEIINAKKIVVCQFRPTDYETNLDDLYWVKLSSALLELSKNHKDLTFLTVSFSTGKVNDLEPARKINMNSGGSLLTIINTELTPGQAKYLLSKALFSIGQSYHFGVFSLAENTPFIGLYSNPYYHDKLTGLVELYETDNYAINFDDIENLPGIASTILKNRTKITKEINLKNDEISRKVNNIFSRLL